MNEEEANNDGSIPSCSVFNGPFWPFSQSAFRLSGGQRFLFFFSFLNGEKHIPLAAYFYFLFDQFKLFRSVSYSLTRLYFIEGSTSNRIHFHTHWQTKESKYQFSQRSNVSINIPVDLSIVSFLSALFLSFENRKWHQISKTKWQKGIQRKI